MSNTIENETSLRDAYVAVAEKAGWEVDDGNVKSR